MLRGVIIGALLYKVADDTGFIKHAKKWAQNFADDVEKSQSEEKVIEHKPKEKEE